MLPWKTVRCQTWRQGDWGSLGGWVWVGGWWVGVLRTTLSSWFTPWWPLCTQTAHSPSNSNPSLLPPLTASPFFHLPPFPCLLLCHHHPAFPTSATLPHLPHHCLPLPHLHSLLYPTRRQQVRFSSCSLLFLSCHACTGFSACCCCGRIPPPHPHLTHYTSPYLYALPFTFPQHMALFFFLFACICFHALYLPCYTHLPHIFLFLNHFCHAYISLWTVSGQDRFGWRIGWDGWRLGGTGWDFLLFMLCCA